jgi:hypothetical protein
MGVIVLVGLALVVVAFMVNRCNWNLMPILTVTQETLEALGVSSADIQEPILTGHAKRSLEAMLASRGFDVASPICVVVLATWDGVVLTQ